MRHLRAACVGVMLLLPLAACGGAEAEPEAAKSPKDVTIRVVLSTGSHTIGNRGEGDGDYCAWLTPSYVLRDGGGDIVAEGEGKSTLSGTAEVGGEQAELGSVVSQDPYECTLMFVVDAPLVDFYEITVTALEHRILEDAREVEVEETFSREDAVDRVEVEVPA
ncbi:hypothetical protein GCM10023224_05200 [Streptomonospora halophila]|uniref:Lipoprotein n=1 Tax=Streptomonospora halophila TaxID=427369 RepID=A0ABP9G5C0_9ACTN